MSSLDKLAIRGIRSFDPNNMAVIQFYHPLTVIIGHNGSGKTTIIECLKYASTGDMPPNTKGGAFVHDPSMAGTSEVKASVKLRFRNTKHQLMVVERRLQVTKKKGASSGLTMKTLEGTIAFAKNEGEEDEDGKKSKKRTTLSTKCANLDAELAIQMGVSKAILENVIFCHQEDSNWPLSDASTLKKKFDEIFEATKYTKALDQIKVLRKEYTANLKVDKERLSALKTDRERAAKLQTTINKLVDSISVKQGEHDDLETTILKLVKENKNFFTQATRHKEIIVNAETLETRKEFIMENINALSSGIIELFESNSELEAMIDSHEETLKKQEQKKLRIVRDVQDEGDLLEKYEKRVASAVGLQGRLEGDVLRHKDNLATRKKLIGELAEKHEIIGFDDPEIDDDHLKTFSMHLEAKIEEQQRIFTAHRTEASAEENKLQEIISTKKLELNENRMKKQNFTNQIKTTNDATRQINSQLENNTITQSEIAFQEDSLKEANTKKKELEEKIRKADYQKVIKDQTNEIKELEEKRNTMHDELTALNMQSEERAKLALRRSEKTTKEKTLAGLMKDCAPKFKKYIKNNPVQDTMEAQVGSAIKDMDDQLAFAERVCRDSQGELSRIETEIRIAQKKVDNLSNREKDLKKQIKTFIAASSLDEAPTMSEYMSWAQNEIELCESLLAESKALPQMFDKILKHAEKKHVCYGCNQSIPEEYMDELKTYIESRKPKKQTEAEEDLKGWKAVLESGKKFVVLEQEKNKINGDELPDAQTELSKVSDVLEEAKSRVTSSNTDLAELKLKMEDLQFLKKTAADVSRTHRELLGVEREIERHESELQASGSTATSEEIQQQLADVRREIDDMSNSIEKTRTEFQKQKDLVHRQEKAVYDAELDLNKKRQALKDREALEERKMDNEKNVENWTKSIKELDQTIKNSDGPLKEAQEKLANYRAKVAEDEAEINRALKALNSSAERLESNQREITAFISRDVIGKLKKAEADVNHAQSQVEDTKNKINNLQNQASAIEKTLSEANSTLRNYRDNVNLRTSKKAIEEIEEELEKLDVAAAKTAYRKYDTEYNNMRRKQEEIQAQQAKTAGEIEMMKKDLEDKHSEMKTEYNNIEEKFKKELIKVKVTEYANMDLEKYAKALDSAIMSFHGVKMKEINDTIADLWTKTYQGTDIDRIMIKSDPEGKTAGGRSYNYRVVMQKDNTEMDMRGRCSAGQKVLASIIIRLALAESFGIQCGIMALDEPTTNLDTDNIQALAKSLGEIIKERKGQSNFQLVVITHDEGFLEILGGTGVLDKYWRVIRGDGGQNSTIERQRLN